MFKYALALVACVAAVSALTACGGDDDDEEAAAPLAIEDRLLTAADVEGYDVVREFVWNDATVVGEEGLGTTTIQASGDDTAEALREAGFKAGAARVFEAANDDHGVVIALELDSEQSAEDILAFSADDSQLPCLESCAFEITETSTDIPGARSVQRLATAENIAATSSTVPDRPLEQNRIVFTDGAHFYFVEMVTSPDPAAAASTEALAAALLERVKGAPAP